MRDWHGWLTDRATHRAPVDAHFNHALAWLARQADGVDVLEIGPGPHRDLTNKVEALPNTNHVITADVDPRVARVHGPHHIQLQKDDALPWHPHSFDAVLAREVFEHVFELRLMVQEIARILRPGGRLWFSTVFTFPLHDYETGDYWRLSPKGWEKLLNTCVEWDSFEVTPARELFGSWQLPCNILGWAER